MSLAPVNRLSIMWYAAACVVLTVRVTGAVAAHQHGTPSDGQNASAAVSGTVIDGLSHVPIEDALVELSAGAYSARELTDHRGRFVFLHVRASNQATISVTKAAYINGGLGTGLVSCGGAFRIAPAQWINDLQVQLWQPATVSGRVTDERGEPVVSTYVQAIARVSVFGEHRVAMGPRVQTNDQGEYRISGLLPGSYFIMVPPSVSAWIVARSDRPLELPISPSTDGVHPLAYPVTFFPGGQALDDALAIDVDVGQKRNGIDVALSPTRGYRVSGNIVGLSAQRANGLLVRLVPSSLEGCSTCYTTAAAKGGEFVFEDVPTGTYDLELGRATAEILKSQSRLPEEISPWSSVGGLSSQLKDVRTGESGLRYVTSRASSASGEFWGLTTVVVDADVHDIVLQVHHTVSMHGRVVMDVSGAVAVPTLDPRLLIRLDPVDSDLPSLTAETVPGGDEDAFVIGGITPGKYLLRGEGSGWVVKSIVWNEQHYTDMPFEVDDSNEVSDVIVTLTNAAGSLSATVVGATGMPARDARVVVFPRSERLWQHAGLWPPRIRFADVDGAGVVQMDNVPAGEYWVAALPRERAQLDPDSFRATRTSADAVTISWGARTDVRLVVLQQ